MNPLELFKAGNPKKSKKSKIVFEENKAIYIAMNNNQKFVCEVVVDGGLICNGLRCDYGLWVDDGNMYLIELKGRNISHACEQLLSTYKYFKNTYSKESFVYKFRVVCSKYNKAPNLEYKKKELEKISGSKVLIHSDKLEERI